MFRKGASPLTPLVTSISDTHRLYKIRSSRIRPRVGRARGTRRATPFQQQAPTRAAAAFVGNYVDNAANGVGAIQDEPEPRITSTRLASVNRKSSINPEASACVAEASRRRSPSTSTAVS